MKIHEHQAKEIFAHYGITTPKGKACFSLDEAREAICNLNSTVWVIKAQIHAGGRGKGGGVKVAQTREEAEAYAESILGMTLVTHQTGAAGTPVRRLLIEEGANIAAELYMGLDSTAARKIATDIGVPASALNEAVSLMEKLYRLYEETDASLIEINPLVVTDDGGLLALDGKMNFDDNALFRQPNIAALHDPNEEDAMEVQAAKHDLSYISLEGNIGCMVNGAGLAMATMDIIKLCGGEPANFLDVGGGADKEKVAEAFKLMLVNPGIRAILINIFGGIMRCDIIAEGVVAAAREMEIAVPLVVRLEGTNVEQGKKILAESGLAITTASDMADAAQKAVAAAA